MCDAINRFIQAQSYGKNFRVEFLNVSQYNYKEVGDSYLKAASYGLPTISAYAASQGIGQAELDSMSFLEGHVLQLQDMFRPIISSTQLNSNEISAENEGSGNGAGAPRKELEDTADNTEKNQESAWGVWMKGKLIYVFSQEDKNVLEINGFTLLKQDEENNIYIFAYDDSLYSKFGLDNIDYYLSDSLTF